MSAQVVSSLQITPCSLHLPTVFPISCLVFKISLLGVFVDFCDKALSHVLFCPTNLVIKKGVGTILLLSTVSDDDGSLLKRPFWKEMSFFDNTSTGDTMQVTDSNKLNK